MNFNEIAKIFNEQGWKLNHIIVGFSIGILAFSIQTLQKDVVYNYLLSLYISWGALFITLILGLVRFHLMQKTMTLQAKKAYDHEVKKIDVPTTTPEIQSKSHQIHILYILMLVGLFIGLFSFAFFKITNIG